MTTRPSYDSSLVDAEKDAMSSSIDEKRSHLRRPSEQHASALPASVPYANIPTASPANLPFRSYRRPWWARMKTEYTLLSRTKKVALFFGLGVLIVFVIGLAAGLSARSHSSSSAQNLPLPNNHGGPYAGDLTYYDPGLGSCGITSTSKDSIVAVSHLIYDAVSTGSNPNANPLCGKKIRARRDGKSIDLTVVDRCVGCKATDLDVTETVFGQLANIDQGRVLVEWAWLEDVPGGGLPSATTSATSVLSTSALATSNTTAVVTATSTPTILVTTTVPVSTTTESATTAVVSTTEAPVVVPTTTAAPVVDTTTEAPPAPTTDSATVPPPETTTADPPPVPTTTDAAATPVSSA